MRMKNLDQALGAIVNEPTPDALVALQGAMLASGQQGEGVGEVLEIAGRFHAYLCELQSKIAAKEYSEFASRLDIGAVGAVAVENMMANRGEELWQSLLLGGLGESLMVAASRQYIKAWETETGLIHNCALWYLREALWRASSEMQPGLPSEQRWQAIQSLLAPVHDPDVPAPDKAALLGRIFQMLLLTRVAALLPSIERQADG
jgi:hypothetical protein